MRVEVTIDKTKPLPAGAIEALTGELGKRVNRQFPDAVVQVRYASSNGSQYWAA
jgi:DNA-damage-inducible protein I